MKTDRPTPQQSIEEILDEIAHWFSDVVDEFDELPDYLLPKISETEEYWTTLGDRIRHHIEEAVKLGKINMLENVLELECTFQDGGGMGIIGVDDIKVKLATLKKETKDE